MNDKIYFIQYLRVHINNIANIKVQIKQLIQKIKATYKYLI